MNHISVYELVKKMKYDKISVIDVRGNYEYSRGCISGAINIPANQLILSPNSYLDKNKTYYIYCQGGHISNDVVNELNHLGFHTVNIDGGYNNYLLMK